MKKITEFDLTKKTILLRIDLNLPIKDGKISDYTRIIRSLETINYLIDANAKIVILSHMGRPNDHFQRELSLAPIADEIEKFINRSVGFISDIWSNHALDKVKKMSYGDIILLENLRFWPGEKSKDQNFIKRLAKFGDFYINDTFSCSHRDHASISGLPKLLPSAAGFSLINEIKNITSILSNPNRPYIGVIGGSKISTKINLLNSLVKKLDYLVISGSMANYFLVAEGYFVGDTKIDDKYLESASKILYLAKTSNCKIILPKDIVVSKGKNSQICKILEISKEINFEGEIYDIGIESVEEIIDLLKKSKILVWNGALGMFENNLFDVSTKFMIRKIASLTKAQKLISIAGGGDTLAIIKNTGLIDGFSYISTGGGAFLEWLEGTELPGVKALL